MKSVSEEISLVGTESLSWQGDPGTPAETRRRSCPVLSLRNSLAVRLEG